ncbi:MAG TPA: hypothetical protein VGE42_00725 [Candidatus Dormibacteraeota bacterium]
MPCSTLDPNHPRWRRRLRRPGLLALPVLLALAASPLSGFLVPPSPLVGARAADCALPPALCPPTPEPTATVTPSPATPPPTPSRTVAPVPPPPPPAPKPASTPSPAVAPPPPAPTPPGAALTPSPAVAGAATGVRPRPRDAAPVRTLGTVRPTSAAVQAWQVVAGGLTGLALAALLVLRVVRQRRRAAIHARFNRMRVERGLPPLTPKQIDFLGPRRRY